MTNDDEKPLRLAVAAVIRTTPGGEFLAVRRPLDDDRLPGIWGLPAVSLQEGELPESAVRRIGTEKLGVQLKPVRTIGVGSADRGDHQLVLMDIEALIESGEPRVEAATTSRTRYIDQRWTADPELLRDGASRGSVCCRIFLNADLDAPSPR